MLTELCPNNIAEYNALIIGPQIAKDLRVKYLKVYGDSKLVVNQVKGQYDIINEDLISHHQAAIFLAKKFRGFFIYYVSQKHNTHVDALASLVATLALHPR